MTDFKAFWVEKTEDSMINSVITRSTDDLPEGDVLIKVAYSSVNYKDALSATGNPNVTRNHILQGCERQVLDALIKHTKPKDIALLIHDCIVYYTPKNTSDLSRIVFEETGFDLSFSEELY